MSEKTGPDAGLFRTRAMTPEEQQLVDELTKPTTPAEWFPLTFGYIAIALAFIAAVYFWGPIPQPRPGEADSARDPFLLAGGGVAVAIFVFSAARFARRRREEEALRRTIEQDVGEGLVEAARVRSLDVAQLDYPGRRQPTLVFRIGPRRAVAVYSVSVAGDGPLPTNDFEYVRLRRTKHCIRVIPWGERIMRTKHLDGPLCRFDEKRPPECEPFELDWQIFTDNAVEDDAGVNPFYRPQRYRL